MGERISKKTSRDVMDIVSNIDKLEILGDGRYRIPSQSVEGKMYTTVVGDEAVHCDCPWCRKGTRICKHIRAARIFNAMAKIAEGVLPGRRRSPQRRAAKGGQAFREPSRPLPRLSVDKVLQVGQARDGPQGQSPKVQVLRLRQAVHRGRPVAQALR